MNQAPPIPQGATLPTNNPPTGPIGYSPTWKCRRCKNKNQKTEHKCICGLTQQQNKECVKCRRCGAINERSHDKCRKCNTLRKRKLQESEAPILSRQRLLQVIYSTDSLRTRAMCCILYLTGARISEVVGKLKPNQFTVEETDGEDMVYIEHMHVSKKRRAMVRRVPINVEKEQDFLKPINDYLAYVSERKSETTPIFNMTRFGAYKIIRDLKCPEYPDGLFPHFFRHQRLSHLVTFYGFSMMELKEFSKHSQINNLDFYIHLGNRDIALKMIHGPW